VCLTLPRPSHHVWARLEGRGFSPAEIAAPALYSSRTPAQFAAASCAGCGTWK